MFDISLTVASNRGSRKSMLTRQRVMANIAENGGDID